MFIDGRTVSADEKLGADIAIVGAGAAGITLARALKESGLKIALIESGGFEWSNFYAGYRVARHAKYCVGVVLNPPGGLQNKRIVSYAYYHSPFIKPVLVAALRTTVPCVPARQIARP